MLGEFLSSKPPPETNHQGFDGGENHKRAVPRYPKKKRYPRFKVYESFS